MTPEQLRRLIADTNPAYGTVVDHMSDRQLMDAWDRTGTQANGFHIDLIIGSRHIPFADITRTPAGNDPDSMKRDARLRPEYTAMLTAGTDPGESRALIRRDAARRLDRLRTDITTFIHDITHDTDTKDTP